MRPYLLPSIEAPDVPTHVGPPSPDLLRELREDESRGLASGVRPILTECDLSAFEHVEPDSLASVELVSEPELRVLAAAFPANVTDNAEVAEKRTIPLIRTSPAPAPVARVSNVDAKALRASGHQALLHAWVLIFAITATAMKAAVVFSCVLGR